MNANSITNPKLIFEPENVDQLLQGWLLHVHKGRDRHDLAARRVIAFGGGLEALRLCFRQS